MKLNHITELKRKHDRSSNRHEKTLNGDHLSPITKNFLILTMKYTFPVKLLWNNMYCEKANKLELNWMSWIESNWIKLNWIIWVQTAWLNLLFDSHTVGSYLNHFSPLRIPNYMMKTLFSDNLLDYRLLVIYSEYFLWSHE